MTPEISNNNNNSHGTFWAVDSEFMMSGRKGRTSDVHSIQFSNDSGCSTFTVTAGQLRRFFSKHRHVHKMYAYNLAAEVGSLRAMLGEDNYETHDQANKLGRIKYGKHANKKIAHVKLKKECGFDCRIYDIQDLCRSLGFRNLKSIGDYLGFPKDEHPAWLGIRKWHNKSPEEKEIFMKYALRDAEITARAAKMLKETWGIDPEIHASTGTIAAEEFNFPERLEKNEETGHVNILSPESKIRYQTFAGRSECFVTGFVPDVWYNDVRSLYPGLFYPSLFSARMTRTTKNW